MIKTIDDITIMGSKDSFMLNNTKNRAHISFDAERNSIHFRDSFGNSMRNHPFTVAINLQVFKLTTLGQTISGTDGSVIAFLSTNDVQELAEKTFYEEGQTRIYDFINQKFTIEF
jgi:hypothetical protein